MRPGMGAAAMRETGRERFQCSRQPRAAVVAEPRELTVVVGHLDLEQARQQIVARPRAAWPPCRPAADNPIIAAAPATLVTDSFRISFAPPPAAITTNCRPATA